MKTVSFIFIIFASLFLSGCGKNYDLNTWQKVTFEPQDVSTETDLNTKLQQVDQLRDSLSLKESRDLALSLILKYPNNSGVLWRAARAESDEVFLSHAHEEDQRSMAALSALEYAKQAVEIEPDNADIQAWYAYSLGVTTHLQPMFSRASHAKKTEQAALKALDLEPDHPVACYTMALLNYRLQTLPWIAKVMSVGKPSSDLNTALEYATKAYSLIPSIENGLLLSRIQLELDQTEEANQLLQELEQSENLFPRDEQLRDSLYQLLTSLNAQ